jgi:hypothetical protein
MERLAREKREWQQQAGRFDSQAQPAPPSTSLAEDSAPHKVRIYQLSQDLGLSNIDVLAAAEELSIAARSHSSLISEEEAARIVALIQMDGSRSGGQTSASSSATAAPDKTIFLVEKVSGLPPLLDGAGQHSTSRPCCNIHQLRRCHCPSAYSDPHHRRLGCTGGGSMAKKGEADHGVRLLRKAG